MIADRMKSLRDERGLSQSDVARALNVNRMTINNYENGKRTPDIEFAMNCADFFEVTVEYLSGRTEFRNTDDFNNTVEKVQYLVDIIEQLPKEDGRQMTNAFAEVLRLAKRSETSEILMTCLTNTYIQYAQVLLSCMDLKTNLEQSTAELAKANVEPELIRAVLQEKPLALYAHGISAASVVSALMQEFVRNLTEKLGMSEG